MEDNQQLQEVIQNYAISPKEFIQIPAADGKTMLNAWIMKPVNFDPNKAYPLLITQYSGPNSQQVKNSWGGINWLHYLTQEGYIVACIDPRGTAARGEEFRKCTYMQLGKLESDDMIALLSGWQKNLTSTVKKSVSGDGVTEDSCLLSAL